MNRESGRILKRSGERIWGVLALAERGGIRALRVASVYLRSSIIYLRDLTIYFGVSIRGRGTFAVETAPQSFGLVPSGSPLDNVGPVPDELRRDPFPGGSIPWSIQEAEKEQGRLRELMIWKVAIAVSWLVTAVAVLRSLGAV